MSWSPRNHEQLQHISRIQNQLTNIYTPKMNRLRKNIQNNSIYNNLKKLKCVGINSIKDVNASARRTTNY
jgi:hypothetical protein